MTPEHEQIRTREELEAAMKRGERPDLDAEVEQRVELMQQQAVIQQRIVDGLAKNGRQLRRNAACPCGSGRKFKKCCLSKMKDKVNKASKPQIDTPEETDTDEN